MIHRWTRTLKWFFADALKWVWASQLQQRFLFLLQIDELFPAFSMHWKMLMQSHLFLSLFFFHKHPISLSRCFFPLWVPSFMLQQTIFLSSHVVHRLDDRTRSNIYPKELYRMWRTMKVELAYLGHRTEYSLSSYGEVSLYSWPPI